MCFIFLCWVQRNSPRAVVTWRWYRESGLDEDCQHRGKHSHTLCSMRKVRLLTSWSVLWHFVEYSSSNGDNPKGRLCFTHTAPSYICTPSLCSASDTLSLHVPCARLSNVGSSAFSVFGLLHGFEWLPPSSPTETLSGLLQIQFQDISFSKTLDLPCFLLHTIAGQKCDATLHATHHSKSIVCSGSRFTRSTVMRLQGYDDRGRISVQTYTKSTCLQLLLSRQNICLKTWRN